MKLTLEPETDEEAAPVGMRPARYSGHLQPLGTCDLSSVDWRICRHSAGTGSY
jgi:hypothetical protein